MRDNEPLGLYDELRAKSKKFENIANERRRMLQFANGVTIPAANPFRKRRLARKHVVGFYGRNPDYKRRRKVHEDSELGFTVAQVIKAICIEAELGHDELLGSRRKRAHSWPRHVAMWAIDHYCPDYSLKEVAFLFQRDHTSVMHGIQKTARRLDRSHPWTKSIVADVHQRLMALLEATDG